MLDILANKSDEKETTVLTKLREVLPGFRQLSGFVEQFSRTTKVASEIMKILKTKGLDQQSYKQCYQLTQTLPRSSKVGKRLRAWLRKHIEIQKQITPQPLLVSSDIIESLFGSFKHVIARSPQADMNRTTLLILTLCGNIDEIAIVKALNRVSHNDLIVWEK